MSATEPDGWRAVEDLLAMLESEAMAGQADEGVAERAPGGV
jgi:hypothetical protein